MTCATNMPLKSSSPARQLRACALAAMQGGGGLQGARNAPTPSDRERVTPSKKRDMHATRQASLEGNF